MLTTLLTIYLTTGAIIREPMAIEDCNLLASVARSVSEAGGYLSRDEVPIAALTCADKAVVMLLPASDGDCGDESA